MARIDRDRPRFRREHKEVEPIAGEVPAAATPFAAIARARQREARQKAELSAIAAEFLARRASTKK